MITVLDVEASGLHAGSYPIEVGVALADGRRHSVLIHPEPHWTHWDDNAERLHGISRNILSSRGRPVREVATMLNDILQTSTSYSDAWVVDKPWLNSLFDAARIPQRFRLSPIEQVMTESQYLNWDATKRQVIAELGVSRHRASHDAWIIQQTYIRSCKAA